MSEVSYFESRTGNTSASAGEVYSFLTDIRNLNQFIPDGTIRNWKAEKEYCSFRVDPLGSVEIRLTEKVPDRKVGFSGQALQVNGFSLTVNINGSGKNQAEVKIILSAEMNPILKMMASNTIRQFLDTLINEIEKFTGWNDIRV